MHKLMFLDSPFIFQEMLGGLEKTVMPLLSNRSGL